MNKMGNYAEILEGLSPDAALIRFLADINPHPKSSSPAPSLAEIQEIEREGIGHLAARTGEDYSWVPRFTEAQDLGLKMKSVPIGKLYLVQNFMGARELVDLTKMPKDYLERLARVPKI